MDDKPDVPVVLLDPDLIGMPSLSNVYLTTFSEDAVNTRCFKPRPSLMG
jgi:hypothetical protein